MSRLKPGAMPCKLKKFKKRPLGYHRFQRHGYDRGRGMSGGDRGYSSLFRFSLWFDNFVHTFVTLFIYTLFTERSNTLNIIGRAIIGFYKKMVLNRDV